VFRRVRAFNMVGIGAKGDVLMFWLRHCEFWGAFVRVFLLGLRVFSTAQSVCACAFCVCSCLDVCALRFICTCAVR